MIKFSKNKVLLLHKLIAQETGGSIGLRDEALLDSALENAFAGFGGQEFYPTKEEKGARLGYTLISNHTFVDGNKRIGLWRSDYPLPPAQWTTTRFSNGCATTGFDCFEGSR